MLEFPPIRDIAPPVEPAAPLPEPWMWWTAAALLALLLLAGLFFWMRAAASRGPRPPALPPGPEHLAISALNELRKAPASLTAGDFALELTEILRTFLHRQTGVLARYATSPEILGDRARPWEPPPPPGIRAFREVLTSADALKYGPAADDSAHPDTVLKTRSGLIDSAVAAVHTAAQPPPPPSPPPLPPGMATVAVAGPEPEKKLTGDPEEPVTSSSGPPSVP